MKKIITLLAFVFFVIFFVVAFGFEWLSNTTTWGLFIGLMLIALAVLFITSTYNDKD
jgi:hypothetical protein